MKIVFLNIWEGKLLEPLTAYIRELAPDTDVFCFQEAYPDMAFLERGILASHQKIADFKRLNADDYFPQAIYLRPNLELVSSGTLLKESSESGLVVYLEVEDQGKKIWIANVHGVSQPGHKLDTPGRLAQSETLLTFFQTKEGSKIIGGDFNILPMAESIRMFEKNGFRDLIEEFHIKATRNRYAWELYPKKLYHSDYVFVSQDIEIKRFTVPQLEVSDHLPLILEIG